MPRRSPRPYSVDVSSSRATWGMLGIERVLAILHLFSCSLTSFGGAAELGEHLFITDRCMAFQRESAAMQPYPATTYRCGPLATKESVRPLPRSFAPLSDDTDKTEVVGKGH